MNFRFTKKILILLLFILIIVSCQLRTNKNDEAIKDDDSNPDEVSTIIISEGGGFTGLVEGFTLQSYGAVEHWQKFPSKEKNVLWDKQISEFDIKSFVNRIMTRDLLNHEINKPGNYSYTIEYVIADSTYSWTWSNSGASKELRVFYDSIKSFCGKLKE